jgi:hypothetical protein
MPFRDPSIACINKVKKLKARKLEDTGGIVVLLETTWKGRA